MGVAFELQKAIKARLTPVLAALNPVTVLYDNVPDQQSGRYVVFGMCRDEAWDADDFNGREVFIELHTWSTYNGMKQCKDAMDAIKGSMHNQEFAVVGATMHLCLLDFSESMLDPDGLTRHGVQRFRFLLTEV